MSDFNPSMNIFKIKSDDVYRGVNTPISDSATYYFPTAQEMEATFHGENKAFLYSRHSHSTGVALANALAAMEDAEAAVVTSSGMAAITNTILQLCSSGDHIVAAHTIYGGTFAFLKNWICRFNIEVSFVDTSNIEEVKKAIKPNTKLIYTESISNPCLKVSDIPKLSDIAKENNVKLVVDNTFSPMIISPKRLGADIVVYSLTKFINGKNDTVGGAIIGENSFIESLLNVNTGTTMLLGPTLDSIRASMILKNLYTLHIRMRQHSKNAQFLAEKFYENGIKVLYPGLPTDPNYELMTTIMNKGYGYGGMLAIDLPSYEIAAEFLRRLQQKNVGYLAVSLGYFKTLFSNSGHSTSSEVPKDIQEKIGITPGLTRFSVGLDDDIEYIWNLIEQTLKELKLI